MFYDLLYVYAIFNMTGLLEAGSGDLFKDAGRYLIVCLVILQGWLYLTNYVNRYGEWKWFEYALTAVNMTATVYMTNTISNDWQIVSRSFNLAMLVMLVSVLAMFFCAMYTDSVYYFPEISFGKKHWLSVLVFMVIGGGIMCLPFGSGMVLYGTAVIALGNFGILMGLRRQLTALRA